MKNMGVSENECKLLRICMSILHILHINLFFTQPQFTLTQKRNFSFSRRAETTPIFVSKTISKNPMKSPLSGMFHLCTMPCYSLTTYRLILQNAMARGSKFLDLQDRPLAPSNFSLESVFVSMQ